MEFLYISPEFPPNYAQFVLRLRDAGARVWALGEADFYDMPEHLRSAIAWYVRCHLSSPAAVMAGAEELLRAKASLGTPAHFDMVESHNETWLRLEAFLNERLGIEGLQPHQIDRLKKKSVMKKVFQRCGLSVARASLLKDAGQAKRLAEDLGYPLILKPNEGVGAAGIHRLTSPQDLDRVLPQLTGEYLLEQWIDAPIVTYDGLADHDGQVLFESSLVYGSGVLECVEGGDTFFYVHRAIPDGLTLIGRELVKAFGIRRKFFHFEFFQREGVFRPIEINARPPGGPILDMMNYSADIDLYAIYAAMAVQGRTDPVRCERLYTAYAGRRQRPYALSHPEVLARLGPALVEHGPNPMIFQEAMGQYRYIFRSPDEDDLLRLAELVLRCV